MDKGGTETTDAAILAAYLRWLSDEARLLGARLDRVWDVWPNGAIPASTGIDCWHSGYLLAEYRLPGSGPNEAPEARAERVLRAAGVDLDDVRRRSHWRPQRGTMNVLYGRGSA